MREDCEVGRRKLSDVSGGGTVAVMTDTRAEVPHLSHSLPANTVLYLRILGNQLDQPPAALELFNSF